MTGSSPSVAIRAALCCLLLLWALAFPGAAWAGPVDWREVPATAEGRQWWDAGSLRLARNGSLTVLSRFQPASPSPESPSSPVRPAPGTLYVMELDCGQELFRDVSVNGFPRFRAPWLPAAGDELGSAVLKASCQAGSELLGSVARGEPGDG